MTDQTSDGGVISALGDAGVCPKITLGKEVWHCGHPTQKAKAELELLVLQTAEENLEKTKRALSPSRYAEKLKELNTAIDGGAYQTGGSLWAAINGGPKGQALFLTSLLRERHDNATVADAVKLWANVPEQVCRALAVVVPDFFRVLAEDLPIVNREAWIAQQTATWAAIFQSILAQLTPAASTASV